MQRSLHTILHILVFSIFGNLLYKQSCKAGQTDYSIVHTPTGRQKGKVYILFSGLTLVLTRSRLTYVIIKCQWGFWNIC